MFFLGTLSVSAVAMATWKQVDPRAQERPLVLCVTTRPLPQRIHQILLGDKSLGSLHRVLELATGFYQGKYYGMIGGWGRAGQWEGLVKQ